MNVLLTGASGMVGSSFVRQWKVADTAYSLLPLSRQDLDLRDTQSLAKIMAGEDIDVVVHAAAKVGGIADKLAKPADYLLENLALDNSVVSAAMSSGVAKMIYLSSAAIYPAETPQPIREDQIFEGPLEHANEPYGLAKLNTTKLMEYATRQYGYKYSSVIPSNLYGPGEDIGESTSHLIPSALRKIHLAKINRQAKVEVWGDGTAKREFTYVDDLTGWLVSTLDTDLPNRLNIGCGIDYSIREYYEFAKEVVDYDCVLSYDEDKPSGVPQRLLDSSLAQKLGWKAETDIRTGMSHSYEAIKSQEGSM